MSDWASMLLKKPSLTVSASNNPYTPFRPVPAAQSQSPDVFPLPPCPSSHPKLVASAYPAEVGSKRTDGFDKSVTPQI